MKTTNGNGYVIAYFNRGEVVGYYTSERSDNYTYKIEKADRFKVKSNAEKKATEIKSNSGLVVGIVSIW